jgi:catechol 2,3-dioxygenase-like lactoylglutathione lyase family enzyme
MTDVQLLATVPVLAVSNLPRALAFYREQLGFETEFDMQPQFPYAGVSRGELRLHLDGGSHEFTHIPTHCRFHIRGIDALYEEINPRGVVKPDEQLQTMPHGLRQFSVLDQDGNRICFAEPIDQ